LINIAYQFEESDARSRVFDEDFVDPLSPAGAISHGQSLISQSTSLAEANSTIYTLTGNALLASGARPSSADFMYGGSTLVSALSVNLAFTAGILQTHVPLSGNALLNMSVGQGPVNGWIETNAKSGTIVLNTYSTISVGTGLANWALASGDFGSLEALHESSSVSIASKLATEIDQALACAKIEPGARATAKAAAADAKYLVERNKLNGKPLVMFADDGILTLQWQRADYGVALLFAGDGEVSIAFRKPDQLYGQNGIDIKITEDLPGQFREVMGLVDDRVPGGTKNTTFPRTLARLRTSEKQ
jgi:hypothetical protein